jgi:hypothetical protein
MRFHGILRHLNSRTHDRRQVWASYTFCVGPRLVQIHRPVLFKTQQVWPYLTGNALRLHYESNRLMLFIGLWRCYINIAITILDIIHRPVFYLNHDVSETAFCTVSNIIFIVQVTTLIQFSSTIYFSKIPQLTSFATRVGHGVLLVCAEDTVLVYSKTAHPRIPFEIGHVYI